MKPIKICNEIKKGYINYLISSYPITHKVIRNKFIDNIRSGADSFFKGPVLSITPAFKKEQTITDLVNDKILHPEFIRPEFNPNRKLYVHQTISIKKLVKGRNVVLSTGTGSGKTEAFLIPIINELLFAKDKKELKNEVYAIILYPMNALVNDQLVRLRKYLKNFPDITFGRYIGETKHSYSEAKMAFKNQWGDEKQLKNEMICRDQMQETPPNILITNYSMLEYMLLRPTDAKFFNGNSWKYIVLDEAHVYDGVVGQECSLLLRRLKDRIRRETSVFRCIATSATLGEGKKDFPLVSMFASNLFGELFDSEDVIDAEYKEENLPKGSVLSENPYSFYEEIKSKSSNMNITERRQFLFEKLYLDLNVHKLRNYLHKNKHVLISDLVKVVDLSETQLETLISISLQAERDETRLLPAKYHFFVRAMEGIYASFTDTSITVFLKPADYYNKYRVFELGFCGACGSLYLLGRSINIGDKQFFLPLKTSKEVDDLTDINEADEYYSIVDFDFYKDESHMQNILDDETLTPSHLLCTKCGMIEFATEKNKFCNCKNNVILKLKHLENKSKCIICNSSKNKKSLRQISNFSTGKYAPTYVICKYFYDNLLEIKKKKSSTKDIFSLKEENIGYRKLLCFSDNRQDAAIFASNVEDRVDSFFYRGLMYKVWIDKLDGKECSIPIFLDVIKDFYRNMQGKKDIQNLYLNVIKELINHNKKESLENNYLVGFSYEYNDSQIEEELNEFLGLSCSETKILIDILLDTIRKQSCISFKNNLMFSLNFALLRPEIGCDDIRWPYITNEKNSDKAHIYWYAFCYDKDKKDNKIFNDRKDLIFNKIFNDYSKEDKYKIIDGLYKVISGLEILNDEGKIPINKISMFRPEKWYKCNKCGLSTYRNLRNNCLAKACNGKLIEINSIEAENFQNQNYILPTSSVANLPPEMIAEEHTAQLSAHYATKFQHEFEKGNINLLSCSTTFEMGVDLGDLNAIFLRNVPPSPSNYIQRSGRAGRNADNCALVVTYCQRRAHDLNYFDNPVDMINGRVKVPNIDISNQRINFRHLYSVAISYFFNQIIPDFFNNYKNSNIKNFVENDYPKKMLDCLSLKPDKILKSLRYVFQETPDPELKAIIDNWQWVDFLFNKEGESYSLSKAIELYKDIIKVYEEKLVIANQNQRDLECFQIRKVLKHYNDKNILSFLVDNGILPHYGFPTDVVKIHMEHNVYKKFDEPVDLSRDLRTALSEYAPNNELIAFKHKFFISGIKKLKDKEFPKIKYARCSLCNRLYISEKDDLIKNCCGRDLEEKFYITPEFGFICSDPPQKALGQLPEKKSYVDIETFAGPFEMTFNAFHNNFMEFHEEQGNMVYINTNHHHGFHFDNNGRFLKDKIFNSDTNLGYKFKTDIFAIIPPYDNTHIRNICEKYWPKESYDGKPWPAFWYSVLYAIIYTACNLLTIDTRGINGLLTIINSNTTLLIYDTLPGGSGFSNRVRNNFQDILPETIKRLTKCTCKLSCYSCLRDYSNEKHHNKLNRFAVIDYLEELLNNGFSKQEDKNEPIHLEMVLD